MTNYRRHRNKYNKYYNWPKSTYRGLIFKAIGTGAHNAEIGNEDDVSLVKIIKHIIFTILKRVGKMRSVAFLIFV